MSAADGYAKLKRAVKDLEMDWLQTHETWQDAKADEFEHRYLQLIQSQSRRAMLAMEQMSTLISKIRSDCQ